MSSQAPTKNGTAPKRGRRVTGFGIVAIAVLVLCPYFAFIGFRLTSRGLGKNAVAFASSALVGWLVLSLIFRWWETRPKVASLMGVGGLVLLFVSPWLFSTPAAPLGMAFGAMVAWLPHCWSVVGTRPSN